MRRWVLVGLAGLVLGACEEDKSPVDEDDGQSTPLRVEQIIVSPKAGAAGDTLLLTADVRSSSANPGDIPSVTWTANGGAFVEDDLLTVRWVAPATADVYTVTARAANSAGSASGHTDIFIAGVSTLVADSAGALTLISGGPDFYYRGSANVLLGSDVYRYAGGVTSDAAAPSVANNYDVAFARDLSFEVHWADTTGPTQGSNRPRHIYLGDLVSASTRRITVDRAEVGSDFRHQYTQPSVSPNDHLVTFQGWLPNRYNAAIDSFHVFVYDVTQNTRITVTAGQTIMHNFFPTFSTDQKWLTFVADPTGRSVWELHGTHVNGDVIDTNAGNFVQLSNTGGSIVSGSPGQFKAPLKVWNPVSPELAIVARDGTLYLVQTSPSGGSTLDVTGLPGTPLEMAWSPDGATLAVIPTAPGYGGAIYLMTGANATVLLTVPSGDTVRDLAWSPDSAWLVYRRTRGSVCWLELVDIGASQLAAPIPVTWSWPTGDANKYRTMMSLSPVWGSGNQLFIPMFGVKPSSTEPGVVSIDLSGAVQ